MGRHPRELTPLASGAQRLGAALRHWRTERGLTQDGLGEVLHHSGALIGKVEKADRRASLELCHRADEVLDTGGTLSRLWHANADNTNADQPEVHGSSRVEAVHAAIPRLRRVLDSMDLPDDGATRSTRELGLDVARVSEYRLQARYVDLGHPLPDLISELARVSQLGDGRRKREAARLLTLALRAADGMAFKFGYLDLSARLIDLMRSSALIAEDPLLLATVSYVRTETFFASGDLDTAGRALVAAADQMPTRWASPPAAAAYGALHMRAAVVAGRAGNSNTAADHLGEARRIARNVPEGVYHGTAFGPSSLRIHELAVAVELGDPGGVERAATWHPPRGLPAERRSHYYIDLARAQLNLGHHEDAYRCLESARQVAPEHAREHPQVLGTLSTLLRAHGPPNMGLIDLAAWARVS